MRDTLPTRPDATDLHEHELQHHLPAAPRRRRLLGVCGSLAVVAVIAVAAFGMKGNDAPAAPAAPIIDHVALQQHVDAVMADNKLAIGAMRSYDLQGSADYLDDGADEMQATADILVPVYPTAASYASQAAGHMHNAADLLRAGDITGSTAEIKMATDDINQAAAATPTGSLASAA